MLLHCSEPEADMYLEGNNGLCDESLFTASLRGNSVMREIRETLAWAVPTVMSPELWPELSGTWLCIFTGVGPGFCDITGFGVDPDTALGITLCKLFGVQVALNKDFRLVTGLRIVIGEDPGLVYLLELCEEAGDLTGTGLLTLPKTGLDAWPSSEVVGFPKGLETLGATGKGLLVLEVLIISSLNFLWDLSIPLSTDIVLGGLTKHLWRFSRDGLGDS